MNARAKLPRDSSGADESIGVLIVDDHPAVRGGMRRLIDDQLDMRVVGEAGDARTALELVSSQTDVVVVDYHLGDHSGLRVTRKLRALGHRPRILIYSAFAADALAIAAIVAGADGVLNKSTGGSELCVAIRRLAAGRQYLPSIASPVAHSLSARLDPLQQAVLGLLLHGLDDRRVAEQTQISVRELSRQRQEILDRLAPNASKVLQPTGAHAPLSYRHS